MSSKDEKLSKWIQLLELLRKEVEEAQAAKPNASSKMEGYSDDD